MQMLRYPISLTYIRMHAVPWHRVSSLGISKPHEITPRGYYLRRLSKSQAEQGHGNGSIPSLPSAASRSQTRLLTPTIPPRRKQ